MIYMSRGNQLKRQWQLLQILQSYRYGVLIEELVHKLEVGRRTIERDLGMLRQSGFPIISETGDDSKKRWRLESQFLSSDKFIVEPTELISLYLARQLVSPFKDTTLLSGLEQFLNKIKKFLPQKALNYFFSLEEQIYVKSGATVFNPQKINQKLADLRLALDENRIIEVTYSVDDSKKEIKWLFYPYGLIFIYTSIYLIGYSEYSGEIRTLKLQRIRSIKITGKKFVRPDNFSLERYVGGSIGIFSDSGRPETIRCQFSGWAARLLREQKFHKTQILEKDNGQNVVVSFLLNCNQEFINWILGFGSNAKILEPEKAQKQLLSNITMMANLYK